MTPKIKKIVAREFIMCWVVVLIGISSWLLIYPYNWIIEKRCDAILQERTELEQEIDSVKTFLKPYYYKANNQRWLLELLGSEYSFYLSESKTDEELWNTLWSVTLIDTTPVKTIWNYNFWDKGFFEYLERKTFTPNSFRVFILKNSYNIEETEVKKRLDIMNERVPILTGDYFAEYNYFFVYDNDKSGIVKNALLYAVLILFGVRYLYYATRWSITTLRQS